MDMTLDFVGVNVFNDLTHAGRTVIKLFCSVVSSVLSLTHEHWRTSEVFTALKHPSENLYEGRHSMSV